MNYQHTLQAAVESLHEIEQMLEDFSGHDEIPALDIDLTLQKIRNLYEILLMIRQQEPEPSPAKTGPQEEPFSIPQPDKSEAQPAPDSVTASHQEAKTQGDFSTISEKYSGKASLNESYHEPTDKKKGELTDKKKGEPIGQVKPVSSIKSAIGINDRYTLIRELFNNDTIIFDNTIRILDEAVDFNEAYNFMIQQFNWDMDSETVQMLLDIIRRKYITGRHE